VIPDIGAKITRFGKVTGPIFKGPRGTAPISCGPRLLPTI
jgi:hypothetical protein